VIGDGVGINWDAGTVAAAPVADVRTTPAPNATAIPNLPMSDMARRTDNFDWDEWFIPTAS
jgi:hypothetical protein